VQTAIKENNNWKCTGVYAQNFKKFEIDDNLKSVIEKLMKSFDIKICGVDLLKRGDDWIVIEVNSEPALDFFPEETDWIIRKEIALIKKIIDNSLEDEDRLVTVNSITPVKKDFSE
jgi:glutathione synthase/RimK-type ligase-like ATP-grasp enzyme